MSRPSATPSTTGSRGHNPERADHLGRAHPDGHGYWILYRHGAGLSRYGNAANYGSLPAGAASGYNIATAIFPTAGGPGYWISTAAGAVYNFGKAPNDGGMAGHHLNGADHRRPPAGERPAVERRR